MVYPNSTNTARTYVDVSWRKSLRRPLYWDVYGPKGEKSVGKYSSRACPERIITYTGLVEYLRSFPNLIYRELVIREEGKPDKVYPSEALAERKALKRAKEEARLKNGLNRHPNPAHAKHEPEPYVAPPALVSITVTNGVEATSARDEMVAALVRLQEYDDESIRLVGSLEGVTERERADIHRDRVALRAKSGSLLAKLRNLCERDNMSVSQDAMGI